MTKNSNGPSSVRDARRAIEIWNKGFEEGWILRFAISEKATNRIIGTIFLNNFEGRRASLLHEESPLCDCSYGLVVKPLKKEGH